MTSLERYFDSCAECRLEVGGPDVYRILSEDEIRTVVVALENNNEGEIKRLLRCERQLGVVIRWLSASQPDVFTRGLWEAINAE